MNIVPLLIELGIEGIKERGDEITALCPMHLRNVGRPDRNASWGINANTGLHHCFSCGHRGTLSGLYLDLTGSMPGPEVMAEMVVGSLVGAVSSSREGEHDDDEAVDEWDPGDLIPLSPRMLGRRFLSAEASEMYGVCFDRLRKAWFIPITRPDGELIGAQYKWADGDTMNEPGDVPKSETLFGLPQAIRLAPPAVLLVESPLDVVRLATAGVPAVSSFGVAVSKVQARLLNRYFSTVVLALDNDEAGYKSAPIVTGMLRKMGCPVLPFRYDLLAGSVKDPGEVEDDGELMQAFAASRNPLRRIMARR